MYIFNDKTKRLEDDGLNVDWEREPTIAHWNDTYALAQMMNHIADQIADLKWRSMQKELNG